MSFPPGYELYDYSVDDYGHLRMGIGNKAGEQFTYPFSGNIQSTRIYSQSLSSSDVFSNYVGKYTQNGLEGEWLAESTWENIIYDSNNSYNGNIFNGASLTNEEITARSGADSLDVTKFKLANLSTKGLGIFSLSLDDTSTLDKIDRALQQIIDVQSKIGGTTEALSLREKGLENSIITSTSLYQNLFDIDTAKELSNITKEEIKIQISFSLLQKNNSHRENTLKLLIE
ncbi:hypothetical protein C1N87_31110 (plasmid) [Priestia aryabhattai]